MLAQSSRRGVQRLLLTILTSLLVINPLLLATILFIISVVRKKKWRRHARSHDTDQSEKKQIVQDLKPIIIWQNPAYINWINQHSTWETNLEDDHKYSCDQKCKLLLSSIKLVTGHNQIVLRLFKVIGQNCLEASYIIGAFILDLSSHITT